MSIVSVRVLNQVLGCNRQQSLKTLLQLRDEHLTAAQGGSLVAVAAKARSGQAPPVVLVVAAAAGSPGHQANLGSTYPQPRKPLKPAAGTQPSSSLSVPEVRSIP